MGTAMSRKKSTGKKKSAIENTEKLTLSDQREIAKAGMVTSMGALFLTGFTKFKGSGSLHTWAGWALLGFSVWHHFLSKPKPNTLSKD
jgi:thiosulfate reductase cytochrome b subunit